MFSRITTPRFGLIFCHGWGFGPCIFADLAVRFARLPIFSCDLGYFSKKCMPENSLGNGIRWVGIGHSLGFIKLLLSGVKFEALVCVNGFTNFLGANSSLRKVRAEELLAMCDRFACAPIRELRRFHRVCGLNRTESERFLCGDVNIKVLADDLLSLMDEECASLTSSIPILIIAGDNDPIVPIELVHDNFAGHTNASIVLSNYSGHILPYKESIADLLEALLSSLIGGDIC